MSCMNKCEDDREYWTIAIEYEIQWKISWVTMMNIEYSNQIQNVECNMINNKDNIEYE